MCRISARTSALKSMVHRAAASSETFHHISSMWSSMPCFSADAGIRRLNRCLLEATLEECRTAHSSYAKEHLELVDLVLCLWLTLARLAVITRSRLPSMPSGVCCLLSAQPWGAASPSSAQLEEAAPGMTAYRPTKQSAFHAAPAPQLATSSTETRDSHDGMSTPESLWLGR